MSGVDKESVPRDHCFALDSLKSVSTLHSCWILFCTPLGADA